MIDRYSHSYKTSQAERQDNFVFSKNSTPFQNVYGMGGGKSVVQIVKDIEINPVRFFVEVRQF